EVTATDSAGTPLRLLRLDRLSTDVVICLLSGVPAQVQIHQPPESLHFGVIDDNVSMSATLRYAAGANAGQQIYRNGAAVTVPVTTRTGSVDGVVDVTKTAAAMVAALAMDPGAFGGAEFAIEMVQSAGVQPFIRNPQQSGGK
ncbi:MAG TPA: hypothetical protein VK196_11975, partial [Magnetospirillum sp.]|nr:hypothetical protein [Magnetospirillum sp.]